ncbi:hypothetical protein J2S09_003673 [Bacillus fengqiuensis]|nr:hypothetical protein [Bacillus fengqiuensis]
MEKDAFDHYADQIVNSSKKGANEDIIHVSAESEGYDLRVSNPFGSGKKQETAENKHT